MTKQIPISKSQIPTRYFYYLIIFSLFGFWILDFGFCHSAYAEVYLRDVPEGHYAYDAVYDLIRRGVTGGYPDGTFRGKKLVERYEIAAFISKLAKSFNVKRGMDEKLVEELKSEVSLLQYQVEKDRKETRVSGDFQARWRGGKASDQRGARADYRLKAQAMRNFGERASLKINLDTMDAGFNGGTRDLVREMLDIEGKVKVGPGLLKITSGPGDVNHVDDGLFPGENNVRYRRPRRTVSISASLGQTDFSLEYLVRSTAASGFIDTSEVSPKISQTIAALKLTINPRFFYNSSGDRDARIELLGELKPLTVLVGAAKTADYPHGLYLKGSLEMGENIKLLAQKVGSQYREKFTYNIFDLFDRNLPDGSTNFGLELKKDFGPDWLVRAKGDYTNPGEALTSEFGLGRSLGPASVLEFVYQTYKSNSVGFSQALGMVVGVRF